MQDDREYDDITEDEAQNNSVEDTWQKFPAVFDLLDKHQQPIPDTNFVEEVEQQLRSNQNQGQRSIPQAPPVIQKPIYTNGASNGSAPRGTGPRGVAPPPPPMRTIVPPPAARRTAKRTSGLGWLVAGVALMASVFVLGVAMLLILNPPQLNFNMGQSSAQESESLDVAALPTAVSARVTHNELRTGRSVTLDNGYSFVLEPWDGESRLTVLLMGIDRRPGERGLTYRTDTMILVSIDPDTDQIGMLSIPRDLYVAVPGYSARQRINAPMVLAESYRPGTGPGLAMSTVQYNLGIRVHEYAVFDFKAVIDIVNAIGGIDVSTDYNISDWRYPDMYFGYDPFFLEAGDHHLDGATALKFARTRHGDSDIERMKRQQQVLTAIRERLIDTEMIPRLIPNAPSLLTSLNENLQTSLDLQRLIQLAWYLKDIPAENITTGVLDYRYLSNYTTPAEEQVLIVNSYTLPTLLTEVFGANYSQ